MGVGCWLSLLVGNIDLHLGYGILFSAQRKASTASRISEAFFCLHQHRWEGEMISYYISELVAYP